MVMFGIIDSPMRLKLAWVTHSGYSPAQYNLSGKTSQALYSLFSEFLCFCRVYPRMTETFSPVGAANRLDGFGGHVHDCRYIFGTDNRRTDVQFRFAVLNRNLVHLARYGLV